MSLTNKQITDVCGVEEGEEFVCVEEVVVGGGDGQPVEPTPAPAPPVSTSSSTECDESSDTSVCGYDGDYETDANQSSTSRLTFGVHKEDNNNNNIVFDDNYCSSKPKWICVGTKVLSRWTDGLFYMGLVVQIDSILKKCLIQFEDSSLFWIRFEDLHKQLSVGAVMTDSDILCAICREGTSETPNEIVICDVCNQGYHQRCHKPRIGDEILEPDMPWTCRLCVFALGTKEGGAEKNGVIGRALKHMKSEFPYDLNCLDWDDMHQTNRQKKYCYCGGNGNYYSKMLQCSTCLQWFHEACIQALETPLLYGDHYYCFKCSVCTKGKEVLKRIIMKWSDMIALVINNLALQHQKQFFDMSSDIVTFVQNNSNMLKMSEDITKLTERELQERIAAVLNTNTNRFINGREVKRKAGVWALRLPFPFETPLMFAPPFALQSTSSTPTSPASSPPFQYNSSPSEANSTPKGMPSSVPLIYGACRKGASKYPALNNNPKRSQKNGRSNSFSSSTGSNSCNASTVSFSSRCSLSTAPMATNKKPKPRPKVIKQIKQTNFKREKSEKRVSKFSSFGLNCDDSSDNNDMISIPVIDSLEALIPVPKDFEGANNPFCDAGPTIFRNRVPKSAISARMSADSSLNKRISIKSEPNAVNGADSFESKPRLFDPKSGRGERFNILAQRVRPDGKTEYLLEWQNN